MYDALKHSPQTPAKKSRTDGLSTRLRQAVASFHKEERGITVLEWVLLIFIVVIILIALFEFFDVTVYKVMKAKVRRLMGLSPG